MEWLRQAVEIPTAAAGTINTSDVSLLCRNKSFTNIGLVINWLETLKHYRIKYDNTVDIAIGFVHNRGISIGSIKLMVQAIIFNWMIKIQLQKDCAAEV